MKKIFLILALSFIQCTAMQKSDKAIAAGQSEEDVAKATALSHLYAAHYKPNSAQTIKKLLEQGNISREDLNRVNAETTPLLAAIGRGNEALVRLLLEHGADPELQAGEQDPLLLACENGHSGIIIALLEFGARPHTSGYLNEPFDVINLFRVSPEAVAALISAGAFPGIGNTLRSLNSGHVNYNDFVIQNLRLAIAAAANFPRDNQEVIEKIYEGYPLIQAVLLQDDQGFEKTVASYKEKKNHYGEINEAMMVAYGQESFPERAAALYALLKTFPEYHKDLIESLRLVLQSAVVSGRIDLVKTLLALPELDEGENRAAYFGDLLEIALMRGHAQIMELLLHEQPSLDEVASFMQRPLAAQNVLAHRVRPALAARELRRDALSYLSLLPRDLVEYLIGPMVLDNRK